MVSDIRPLISVVVPCFNEEGVLADFVRRMTAACHAAVGESYEIIIVDDGSQDDTFTVAETMTKHRGIIVARLARNFGHQAAATTGLSMARGTYILLIDADLQDPPELLPDMLALIVDGADVVYGHRVHRAGEGRFKIHSAAAFYRILGHLSSVPIPQDTGDFRLMRRRVVETLVLMPEQQRFLRGMVSWIGGKQVALPYHRDARFAGTTKYSLGKMVAFAADAIASFSIRPLRIAIYIAALSGSLAVVLLAYTLFRWMDEGTIPGWTSLMCVLSFFSCIQFLVLGVLGEYLGRTFIEVKRRPLFLIDRICLNGESYSPPAEFGALSISQRLAIIDDLEKSSVTKHHTSAGSI